MIIDCEQGKRLVIKCDFRENDIIRGMPSKRFDSKRKAWVAPLLSRNVQYLMKVAGGSNAPAVQWTSEASLAASNLMKALELPKVEPIPLEYKFKTEPLKKQLECLEKFHNFKVCAFFMGTGTGKSKTLIDKMSIHYVRGEIDAAIVLCPATVKPQWMKVEMAKHCPIEYDAYVHDGDAQDFNEFMMRPRGKLKVMFVSSEALSIGQAKKLVEMLKRFMLAHRTFLAVDEGHDFKNPKSTRTEHLLELSKYTDYKLIMTGTPIDEGLMDLFAYFEFLDPNILGFGDFYSFRARYAIMGGFEDKQVVSYQNVDELMNAVRPYVFQCTKEEMVDLPPKTYQKRWVKMTDKQKQVYKTLKKSKRIEHEGIEYDVENTLERMMLLQYVTAGYFSYPKLTVDPMDEDGEAVVERAVEVIEEVPPKVKELMRWLEEIPKTASVIIWSRWRLEMDTIVRHLVERYGEDQVVQIRGGASPAEKERAREAFESGKSRFCVAHPASGGVGLTLIRASYVAYLSNTFRLIHRIQSEDRCHRIGQSKNVTYVDFVCEGTVDVDVLAAIENKQNVADWVKNQLSAGNRELCL